MAKRQAGKQAGFAVASRLALDRDPDLAPAIPCKAAINRLHEFTLARQQPHFLAGKNSFCDGQHFEKGDHAISAGLTELAPRIAVSARRLR
jgi:hypothetical protein